MYSATMEHQQLATAEPQLQRSLNTRMLNMIAIGGSIGTGIFLASGNAIALAGPGGTLIAYTITGLMVYFLMTSLGEMAAFMPNTGSFYVYATHFIDPALGYALGWNYWYNWAITVASEIVAASLVMQYWFPAVPGLIWSSAFLTTFVIFNAFSAKSFGKIEYWFSFIKITAIIVFIIAGASLAFGVHNATGFSNWKIGDAPFHNGMFAIFSAFMIAGYSFQGTELIGIAAGESKSPSQNIPRAIRNVFWRILLFFVLSIFIISLLIPYNSPQLINTNVETSPFTLVFKHLGIGFAASLMNGIILIAILSAGNSGMYAATRMLWYLSKKRHVPAIFSKVNNRGVPMSALIATTTICLLAFLATLFGNGRVYLWLLNASSLSGFIAWLGIAISHYRFRKAYLLSGRKLSDLPYVAKGYPFAPLIAFSLCLIIILGQNHQAFTGDVIDWSGVIISYIGIPIFLTLWLGYKFIKKTKVVNLKFCNFDLN